MITMKKALLSLSALIAVSCQKPLDERAIEITVRECNNLGNGSVILDLDLPVDNEYLTLEQIAYVDKRLQDTTDCFLTVYLENSKAERFYIVQKEHSPLLISENDKRFEKVYPIYK